MPTSTNHPAARARQCTPLLFWPARQRWPEKFCQKHAKTYPKSPPNLTRFLRHHTTPRAQLVPLLGFGICFQAFRLLYKALLLPTILIGCFQHFQLLCSYYLLLLNTLIALALAHSIASATSETYIATPSSNKWTAQPGIGMEAN